MSPATEQHAARIARRMIAHYGRAYAAAEAAHDHATDHPQGSHGRAYWQAVRRAILRLAAESVKPRSRGDR